MKTLNTEKNVLVSIGMFSSACSFNHVAFPFELITVQMRWFPPFSGGVYLMQLLSGVIFQAAVGPYLPALEGTATYFLKCANL